jgi:diacylglycerol O-acyltransferase / wax synthase
MTLKRFRATDEAHAGQSGGAVARAMTAAGEVSTFLRDALQANVEGAVRAVRRRERMSSIDTAWLRMDSDSNLMTIVGVHMFDSPVDFERLRSVITERFLTFARFRERVVVDLTGAWWEPDPHFDLDSHLHRMSLPGNRDKQELESLVADLASQPLDHTKPLWQMHLIDNYQGPGATEQVLIVRIHHCIADGIALIGVLLSMTDETAHGPATQAAQEGEEPGEDDSPSASGNRWDPIFRPITAATVKTIEWTTRASSKLSRKSIEMMTSVDGLNDYGKAGAQLARDIASIALMESDTQTRMKGKPGISKLVAWTEPMPLDEVKVMGRCYDCSVNDILLSCVAGAIREYLEESGDDTSGCEIRAMVPVNLRPAGEEHKLGNRFGLVPLVLPVGIANPIERLHEVKRRMEELKTSFQPLLAMGVLGAVGFAPRAIQTMALNLLAAKATAVMTNVPGPTKARYIAGARMSQIMFWVPQSGNIGVGVSILSYNQGVQFGLITDKKLVPDPQRVIEKFAPEFEKLVLAQLLDLPNGHVDHAPPRAAAVPPKRRVPRKNTARTGRTRVRNVTEHQA